jgi:hypothetical protein
MPVEDSIYFKKGRKYAVRDRKIKRWFKRILSQEVVRRYACKIHKAC